MSKASGFRYIDRYQSGEVDNKVTYEMACAYAQDVPGIYATDTSSYLDMTLRELTEEWNLADPVELFALLAKADSEDRFTKGKPP